MLKTVLLKTNKKAIHQQNAGKSKSQKALQNRLHISGINKNGQTGEAASL